MKLYAYKDKYPQIDESAYVCEGVALTGDVQVGPEASLWFGTVARGDINHISIGAQSNVQDGTILHVDDDFACEVGERVVIGHQAVLHGTTIKDKSLIGIGAKLLNGSIIGEGALVAAGSLVPEGMEVPPGMLVMGVPAKVVRPVSDQETAMIDHLADKYIRVFKTYQQSVKYSAE